MWSVTETHLTKQGCEYFQRQLRCQAPGSKFIHGAYAGHLSSSCRSIGGKATGVGICANFPLRAMSQEWSQEDWQTARLQVGAAFIEYVMDLLMHLPVVTLGIALIGYLLS